MEAQFDDKKELLRKQLRRQYGQVWDTEQLQKEFDIIGFTAGVVSVSRKSDKVKGTLNFTHIPRLYFQFQKAPSWKERLSY